MSSPFQFSPPEPVEDDSLLSLLSSLTPPSPTLPLLVQTLLAKRIALSTRKEMSVLAGELRDEWKVRVGGVKADWMARIIPEGLEEEDAGEEEGGEGEGKKVEPTILDDTVERDSMVKRVDEKVEKEFQERISEAEVRVGEAVRSKEALEVEVFVGTLILDAREEVDTVGLSEDAVVEIVEEGVREALEGLGVDADEVVKNAA